MEKFGTRDEMMEQIVGKPVSITKKPAAVSEA